jgi:HK97 family phage major capsid protein/HK97 family phage prohead protease
MNPEDLAGAPPARLPFAIIRAQAPAIECRGDDPAAMPTMFGRFSTFGDWYEVDSMFEGHFMESLKHGAFRKTIAESRDSMKVLYDHGMDPQIGNKVLGTIEDLHEDRKGAAYAVPLFDTSYNRDLVPGLRAGAYGSSFRFTVEKDQWDNSPEQSDYNPTALPERTITEARVYEFGPVTFPANPNATAGVRSTTDEYYQRIRSRDPESFESLLRSAQVARTPVPGAAIPPVEPPPVTPPEPMRADTPRPSPTPAAAGKENRTVEYVTREEKASRLSELRTGLERQAVEYPGVLPPDAQTRWDEDTNEAQTLERDIAAWDARQAQLATYAADPAKVVRAYTPPTIVRTVSEADIYDITRIVNGAGSPERRHQALRDNAMRSAEISTYPHPDTDPDKAKAHIQYLLDEKDTPDSELARRILRTNSPAYRRGFNKVLAGMPTTTEERAALEVHDTALGNYAVPAAFDPTIVPFGAHTAVNPFRAACRVESIVGTNVWNAVASSAVTATRVAEAAVVADASPTFTRPTVTVQRVQSLVQYSIEMGQDRPDLASEIAKLIGEAKDTEEEASFALGAGTTVLAWGMFSPHATIAFTHIQTANHVTYAIGDIYALEAALPIRWRANAAWFGSRAWIRATQALETSGGQLFGGQYYNAVSYPQQSPTGNTGLQLLRYPVWEVPSAPYALVDDTVFMCFGDPKNYVIVDRVGMNVEIIPHMFDQASALPNGVRGFYAQWRNNGWPFNADGMRLTTIL